MKELSNSKKKKTLVRYLWSFEILKPLRKCNNAVFRVCKEKRKVQRTYLAFKNLKIKRRQGNHSKEKQGRSTADAFGGPS